MKKPTLKERLQKANDEIRELERQLENSVSADENNRLWSDYEDAQSEIDRLTGNFDYALQSLRANRIEHALFELEKALPDEFIGFAETIVKWSKKA